MVVFSLFFGKLAGVPSDDLPYPIFSFAALVPWTFFANGLTHVVEQPCGEPGPPQEGVLPPPRHPHGDGARRHRGLRDRVRRAPRDDGLLRDRPFDRQVVWIPALLLLALVTALGVGLWFAALNVLYRDVAYVVPFTVQFWLFATPIAYPSSMLPEPWRTLYGLNPMAGVVEGFRWSLLGTETAPGPMLVVSALAAVAILVGGIFYFRRMERTFADEV
jgi:lipopolysaccharide transport system permease protein